MQMANKELSLGYHIKITEYNLQINTKTMDNTQVLCKNNHTKYITSMIRAHKKYLLCGRKICYKNLIQLHISR